jgi:hypothetical protein
MFASSACSCDSFERTGFGEVQYINAKAKHRRAGFTEVEPPLVDFPKVAQQLCFDGAVVADKLV